MRPDRPQCFQAQEKPDLVAQPESAPAGMALEPEAIRKLEAEMIFLPLRLEHFGQLTSVAFSVEVTMASNSALHSWQRYS